MPAPIPIEMSELDDALAKLAEVLEKGHGARGLIVWCRALRGGCEFGTGSGGLPGIVGLVMRIGYRGGLAIGARSVRLRSAPRIPPPAK